MSTQPLWLTLTPEATRDSATLTPLPAFSGEQALVTACGFCTHGREAFVSQPDGTLNLLLVDEQSRSLTPIIEFAAGTGYQQLSDFMLGGQLHLLAYNSSDGIVDFYRVDADRFVHQYRYQRTYGDTTNGFTTVHAFSYRDLSLFMMYDKTGGNSRLYQLTVPPQSPLGLQMVWQSEWAKGWENFSFFTLGAENFFFKMNPRYNAVNIDHYMDNPAQGSHPVGTGLPLSMDTTLTATVNLQEGPGFIAYETGNGLLTANRFHSDCLGWTEQGKLTVNSGYRKSLVTTGQSAPLIALLP